MLAIASAPESPGRTRSATSTTSSSASATSASSRSARMWLVTRTPLPGGQTCFRDRSRSWSHPELLRDQLQGLAVARLALAGDRAQHEAVEDGEAPPLLPRHHVGDVDLHRRQPGQLEGVTDRPAVMRPGAGVHDHGVGELRQPVQVLDELALVVGLELPGLEVELPRPAPDLLLELGEGEAAVVLGITATEDVQVCAVHDLDAVVGGRAQRSSSTAALTISPRSATPVRTSPGRSTSTNPTPSAPAFLSRSIAASTASTSI